MPHKENSMDIKNTVKGKKVVVVGGSGFVGSFVADKLTDLGAHVSIYDKNHSRYLSKEQEMITGDILDKDKLRKVLEGASYVYNFAGIADIDEADNNPEDAVRYNILANTSLLKLCKDSGVKRFIYASSIYVYGDRGSFYRVSKLSSELMIEVFYEKYGLNYTILRYGSLYGPRSNEKNGIYRMIYQALIDKRIVYAGSGEEIREYIHVQDAAQASVKILEDEFRNNHIILTGNQIFKAKDVLTMVQEMLKDKINVTYTKPSPIHYQVTPYSFHPRLGKKMTSAVYIDMGQGLLEVMKEIYEKNRENR